MKILLVLIGIIAIALLVYYLVLLLRGEEK